MLRGLTFWITGATGRLGCAAAARLEELGAGVVPLVLPGYPDAPRRVPWAAGTRPVPASRASDLSGLPNPDYVLNLHWRVDRGLSERDQLLFEIESNLTAPMFLWERLRTRPARCFLHVSSLKVFSFLNDDPVTAASPPRPVTAYGIAKAASESWFDMIYAGSGAVLTQIRLGSVASVGEHPSQLMARLSRSAFEGLRIQVNAGHRTRLYYIDEAVDLLVSAALAARPGRYNLAAAGLGNEDIARRFEDLSGRALNAEFTDLEPGRRDIEVVSDAAAFDAPWVRRTPIDETIRAILREDPGRPGGGAS